jgi:hypothetical protein
MRTRFVFPEFCGCFDADECLHLPGGDIPCETHREVVAMGTIDGLYACPRCLDEDERGAAECKEHPGHPAAQCGPCDGVVETPRRRAA